MTPLSAPTLDPSSPPIENFSGVPVLQIAYALAQAFVANKLTSEPWVQKLAINPEDVKRACEMDGASADEHGNVEPIHLGKLIQSHIQSILDFQTSPEYLSACEQKERRGQQRLNDEIAFEERNKKFASVLRVLGVNVAGLAVAGGAIYLASPRLADWYNQTRMDLVAGVALGTRDDAIRPVADVDLDGATIQFACRQTGFAMDPVYGSIDTGWRPVNMLDLYNTDDLAQYFGVTWDVPNVPRTLSLAQAGWGTTVSFTKEQLERGVPGALAAQIVEADNVKAYILPTANLFIDRAHLGGAVFVTGAFAADGRMMTYYLMDPVTGVPACYHDKAVGDGEAPVRQVTATLVKEFPERGLDAFGVVPDLSPQKKADFAEYDLGGWYESIYSGTVQSADFAVRDASRRGLSQEHLQAVSDYFTHRQFEDAFLRFLHFAKNSYGPEEFKQLVESIKEGNAPVLNLTEETTLREQAAAGLQVANSRGGMILLSKDAPVEKVLTHELFHAFIQGSPYKNGIFSRSGAFDERDSMAFEALTELYTQIGLGKMVTLLDPVPESATYQGRIAFVQALLKNNEGHRVLSHYLLHPKTDLSASQMAVLIKLSVELPTQPATRQLYAMLLDQFDVSTDSSQAALQKVKDVFKLMDRFAATSGSDVSEVQDKEKIAALIAASL